MDLIVDFILLAASGAAAFYCAILSRRLARLNDTRDGLGASIASMSEALRQTQDALSAARVDEAAASASLAALIEEAHQAEAELAGVLDAISELADIASADIDEARSEGIAALAAAAARLEAKLRSAVALPEEEAPIEARLARRPHLRRRGSAA
jgi:ABC-type transporter Mla subunit MlaD